TVHPLTTHHSHHSPRWQVPHAHAAVVAAADGPAAIVGEGDAGDSVVVPREAVQDLAGRHVPVLDAAVVAAGDQAAAVAGDRHADNSARLRLEAARRLLAGGDVPHMDHRIAGREHVLAVRGEGDIGDRFAVAVEGLDGIARVEIEDAHGLVHA